MIKNVIAALVVACGFVAASASPAYAAACTGEASLRSARLHYQTMTSTKQYERVDTSTGEVVGYGSYNTTATLTYNDCADAHAKVMPFSAKICVNSIDVSNDPGFWGMILHLDAQDNYPNFAHYHAYLYAHESSPIIGCKNYSNLDLQQHYNAQGDLWYYKTADDAGWGFSMRPAEAYNQSITSTTQGTTYKKFKPATDPYATYF